MSGRFEEQPDTLRLLDLDADVEPSGPAVRIGGRDHHFKSNDELTIADRENLMLFSIRLREIREAGGESDDLLPETTDERIVAMQRRILRIALPTVSPAMLDELEAMKVHLAVNAFISGISPMSWMHWTTYQWIVRELMPRPMRTDGATTLTPTEPSTDASESGTPASKPVSDPPTVVADGDMLTA